MSQAQWQDRMAEWRSQERERAGGVAVLLDRSGTALQSLVACWPNVATAWVPPDIEVPENDRAAWWALWGPLEPLYPEVARATGLSPREATTALLAAITNRVIWPDGTLPEGAQAWLAATAVQVLSRGGGSRKGKG